MIENLKQKYYGDKNLLHKISLVWLLMSIVCIPVWWKTTSVERYPIPYGKINALAEKVKTIPESGQR